MHTGWLFKNKVKQTVMKYKVGDKVRVKSLEWYNQNKDSDGNIYLNDFGIPFIKEMSVFCGRKAVIASIFGEEYKIDIDKNRWYWKAWMLEDDLLNEADSDSAELKDTIEVIKEKRFQAACYAMQGLCVGKITAYIKKGQCSDIAEIA